METETVWSSRGHAEKITYKKDPMLRRERTFVSLILISHAHSNSDTRKRTKQSTKQRRTLGET